MNNVLFRSLSLRLLGIFIITGLAVLFILTTLFSRGLGSQWNRSIRPHLAQYVQYVQQDLGNPPKPERARALADQLPVIIYIYTKDQFVFSTNGNQLKLDNLDFHKPRSERTRKDKTNAVSGGSLPVTLAFTEDRHTTVVRSRQGEHTVYYELVRLRGRRDHGNHLMFALLALGTVLLLSYIAIRRQLSPIRKIQHGVGLMTEGSLDHRINIAGHDDLATLGNSIDAMAERINAMLDAKRQLLLAISHELRSPLARARVAAELLPPSVNQERINDDLQEMDQLINDIMESERLQQNHSVLNREALNLNALIEDIVIQYDESISCKLPETPMTILADEARLRILLRNLITNAIQHGVLPDTPDKTPTITIQLTVQDQFAQVQVIDDGPGIAAKHLALLTEPFYRPDASRTRSTGGFGLGLSLCNLIVQAHGGVLDIRSDPDKTPGTVVTFTLPFEPVSQ